MLKHNLHLLTLPLVAFGCLLNGARAEPPVAELLKLHTADAAGYRMFLDAEQKQAAELNPNPVLNWLNLVGEHAQNGHLFVWTHRGRPMVIGTIFSTQAANPKKRNVIHEFHTLATTRLFPVTPEGNAYPWKPERGIPLAALDGAPAVAATSSQRLIQMRALSRTFSAQSRKPDGSQTWELKLLPAPLITYEPEGGDVLSGGLFALISSTGTDPEVLLLIEARHPKADDKAWQWQGVALRFSDYDLTVKRDGKQLWSSLDDASKHADIKHGYTLIETPDKTYTCYRARVIDELPDQ